MTEMTPQEVLALPVEGESGATTIGGFLAAVVAESWEESKRVFGESSWRYEAYTALVKAGVVEGEVEEGYLNSLDTGAAEAVMQAAINALGER